MRYPDVIRSIVLSLIVIAGCHLMIRYGGDTLNHYGSLGFMPGAIVELALSGNPHQGFGDWRTISVVNISSWFSYVVLIYIGLKLWRYSSRPSSTRLDE